MPSNLKEVTVMAFSFFGGIHPKENKWYAEEQKIMEFPEPDVLVIPMSQHIGAPSVPTVKVGDEVKEGDLIASAGAGLSVPQYASISGKVISCDPTKIVIEA